MCLHLLKTENCLDSKNIFVFGGSHGGFIGAFLTGMFPVHLILIEGILQGSLLEEPRD